MTDLLKTYSAQQILIFIIFLAVAFKGVVSFMDWIGNRLKKFVYKNEYPDRLQRDIEQQNEKINMLTQSLDKVMIMINMLVESDKDSIKTFITEKHHFYVYEQKWIDDYTLDCIEKRYTHYKDEGGNSFVKQLMDELRELPRKSFEKE